MEEQEIVLAAIGPIFYFIWYPTRNAILNMEWCGKRNLPDDKKIQSISQKFDSVCRRIVVGEVEGSLKGKILIP